MDFKNMDIATLTRGVSGKGERYLEVFLRAYTAIFPGPLNPQCPRCLNQYLQQYKNYITTMETTCRYRLHECYENIPLQEGSDILINNQNLTDAYALILLNQPNGVRYFAQMPQPGNAPVADNTNPPADVPHPAHVNEDTQLLGESEDLEPNQP